MDPTPFALEIVVVHWPKKLERKMLLLVLSHGEGSLVEPLANLESLLLSLPTLTGFQKICNIKAIVENSFF